MIYTDEILKNIEELASLAFSPQEISIIIEVKDMDAFISDCKTVGTLPYFAFNKGFLKLSAEIRQSIKESAIQGSNPAQNIMLKFIEITNNKINA